MRLYKLHPSSVGKIMTDAKSIDKSLLTADEFARIGFDRDVEEIKALIRKKSKTDADQEILNFLWDRTIPEGGKTYLKSITREIVLGFKKDLDVKAFAKGKMCEDAAIELVNQVYFKSYEKHVGRIETDLLTGECDIYVPNVVVRDIKNAWSLDTFPAFKEDAHTSDYEYQLRSYMHLYDVPTSFLDWCMLDTPEELIKWEQTDLHKVSHIDPCLRVTTVEYKRDMDIEKKLLIRCAEAQTYIERMKKQFLIDHNYEYES